MAMPLVRPFDGLLTRVRAFRERYGVSGVLYKAFDRVLTKVFRTSVNTVVWLDVDSLGEMHSPDPKFSFRFLTADEVEQYSKDPIYFMSPDLPGRVRAGKDLCFAALDGEKLAAFGWYALECIEPEHVAGAALSYPANVAYMYFGYTHPDYRGARLHGLIMGRALQELGSRGVTKLVSIVAWTNWASLKSCYRLGYISLGNMITCGSHKHAVGLYPKAAKRLGVKFGFRAARRS